jgi:hypothetical protein
MTTTPVATSKSPMEPPIAAAASAPGVGRRIALALATLLTAALPIVWGIGSVVDLLSGKESDHRFHQLTGQGVLLSALWLGGLVPLIVAGWRRRTPPTHSALHFLAFAAAVVVAGALAPGNGGAVLAVVVVLTGSLLWWAMPARPALRAALRDGVRLDPVLAPIGLLTAALLTPYILDQAALQRAMANEHAKLSHYFDMAWVSLTITYLAVAAGLLVAARRLMLWAAAGLLVLGAGALSFTDDRVWPVLAVVLGVVAGIGALIRVNGTSARGPRSSLR